MDFGVYKNASEYKDIFLLALCWAWTFSLACLLTFVGPLSAKAIGGSDFFATFTVGIFVIGTAICNLPSTTLFNKYGRRGGFLVGCVCLTLGSFICMMSIYGDNLGMLLVGCCLLGVGVGLGQFYRFAAIDIAADEHKSWAVTTVLTGGCFAAFLGPTLGIATRHMFNNDYQGCYFVMILLGIANFITVSLVTFPPPILPNATLATDLGIARSRSSSKTSQNDKTTGAAGETQISMVGSHHSEAAINNSLHLNGPDGGHNNVTNTTSNTTTAIASENDVEVRGSVSLSQQQHPVAKRTILSIVLTWGFWTPTLINTIAQVLMMIVMINATLELNNRGSEFIYISLVLDMHFFAMFGTGFITGWLLKRYNLFYVCIAGTVLMGVSFVIFLSGTTLGYFFAGDIVLGIAWNMLFSAGTVMLHSCYDKTEQNAIQSINEFIINSISGVFAIVSGYILSTFGWHIVITALLVVYLISVLVAVIIAVYYMYHYGSFMSYGTDGGNHGTSTRVMKQKGLEQTQSIATNDGGGVDDAQRPSLTDHNSYNIQKGNGNNRLSGGEKSPVRKSSGLFFGNGGASSTKGSGSGRNSGSGGGGETFNAMLMFHVPTAAEDYSDTEFGTEDAILGTTDTDRDSGNHTMV